VRWGAVRVSKVARWVWRFSSVVASAQIFLFRVWQAFLLCAVFQLMLLAAFWPCSRHFHLEIRQVLVSARGLWEEVMAEAYLILGWIIRRDCVTLFWCNRCSDLFELDLVCSPTCAFFCLNFFYRQNYLFDSQIGFSSLNFRPRSSRNLFEGEEPRR